jgi:hypothetical protein
MKKIKFKTITNYNGRNGWSKCSGIEVMESASGETALIHPITSKGNISTAAMIEIPIPHLKEVIDQLSSFLPKETDFTPHPYIKEALEKGIRAIDLDDHFGNDIDARHDAESEAVGIMYGALEKLSEYPTVKGKFVQEITVIDPDTKGKVELEVWKDPISSGMLAIDTSFLDQVEDTIKNPFNPGYLIAPE